MTGSPIVNRLDLVFSWVTDMDRAVAFYRDVLGLRLVRREDGNWAEFDGGGLRFALHAVAEGQPVVAGGTTAVFSVDDLDRARGELSSLGVHVAHQGDVEGFARFASFQDPDGNVFQLIEYLRPAGPPA